tara:strand:+ start:1484 stop:2587 length:1104 start_codon:yes stop_codon:yes gene_type:complete
MVDVNKFFKFLNKNDIKFFSGVPDSVLKNTRWIFEKKNKRQHIITANEGSAIASCIGYFLATGKIPCAYMQNSGLGNAINPLISIAHQKVYSVPILLLIGWRGSPGLKDEPQHKAKGAITPKLLKLLGIKYCVLNKKDNFSKLKKLIRFSRKNEKPVACLIKKDVLTISKKNFKQNKYVSNISREEFIKILLNKISPKTKLISTTGFTSRELYQLRLNSKLNKGKDFYMVGGMGHSSMVALGLSLHTKGRVICLDGDGSLIMHMGSLTNIGFSANKNFKHILLNNFSHESVGGQKTNSEKINFKKLIDGAGYKKYFQIKNKQNIILQLKRFLKCTGPAFLEVLIKEGSPKELTRPKNLEKLKKLFMK